jgi:hypothetical protein
MLYMGLFIMELSGILKFAGGKHWNISGFRLSSVVLKLKSWLLQNR